MTPGIIDENLSPRLRTFLLTVGVDAQHVLHAGWRSRPDEDLWEMARATNGIIVTKDDDFRLRSLKYGAPPRVLFITTGNGSTASVIAKLEAAREIVEALVADPTLAIVTIA